MRKTKHKITKGVKLQFKGNGAVFTVANVERQKIGNRWNRLIHLCNGDWSSEAFALRYYTIVG